MFKRPLENGETSKETAIQTVAARHGYWYKGTSQEYWNLANNGMWGMPF